MTQTVGWTMPPAECTSASAKVTEAHGSVYERGFQDWEHQLWGDPKPATVGDTVSEGMQVGTGDKSWAQLTWPNISTRAWANSVYAIAPNERLVYLVGGEMLYHLDKKRKDKSAYFVWTNLLQARIRGTTVLFQCTKNVSRITVLEGCVDVMNRIDHSVVQLKPGVVYEIKDKSVEPQAAAGASAAAVAPATSAGDLTALAAAGSPAIPVFETARTLSTVTTIDPKAILSMPLLQSFTSPLESLPLVQQSMALVCQGLQPLTQTIGGISGSKFFKEAISVQAVPTLTAYKVGSAIAVTPKLTEYFPPSGIIDGGTTTAIAGNPLTLFNGGQNLALPSGAGTALFGASLPFAGTASGADIVVHSAAAQSLGALMPGVAGISGAVGGGLGSPLGATVSGVGGALGSIGGTLGSAGNSLTGTVGGLTGSLGLGF